MVLVCNLVNRSLSILRSLVAISDLAAGVIQMGTRSPWLVVVIMTKNGAACFFSWWVWWWVFFFFFLVEGGKDLESRRCEESVFIWVMQEREGNFLFN